MATPSAPVGSKALFNSLASTSAAPSRGSPCVICKGSKNLCGKPTCALMVKFYSQSRTRKLIDSLDLAGSTPARGLRRPVRLSQGRHRPAGPAGDGRHLHHGHARAMDGEVDRGDRRLPLQTGPGQVQRLGEGLPERGQDRGLHQGAGAFRQLRGRRGELRQTPSGKIVLDDEIQPFGPSARLEKLSITNPKYDHKVEKAYYDTDLKATQAVRTCTRTGS